MENLTVVTATYNRAHTLPRVYASLEQSTYKNFIWLVIDDGSTDETEKYIRSIENPSFKIQYEKKEHAGKYEACNLSYDLATTPYMINLDSDDEILPHGLELIMKAWEQIPAEEYDNTWCVTARTVDSETGKMVGPPFPENVNSYKGRKRWKIICDIGGEKHSCRRVDILKNYKFPKYSDTSKLVPNIVWTKINAVYDQWCVNDLVSVYYQNSLDSLAKSSSPERLRAYYYYDVMILNEYHDQIFYNTEIRRAYIDITRCGWRGGKNSNEILRAIKSPIKKTVVILCMPISLCLNLYTEHIRKWFRKRKII